LAQRLTRLEQTQGLPEDRLEAAAVAVSRQNGEILALAGGRKPGYAGFNRALDAIRPIGSLVKPAVYLSALMQPERYTLISPIDDAPLRIRGPQGKLWSPKNYDRISHGEVPLHTALAKSYNLSTVRLGMELGLEQVVKTLQALGVRRDIQAVPAMLLGALSISPLEVAQVYQTLAADGFYSPLKTIREVQAADSQPLQRYPLTVHRAVPAAPVYLLNRNLQEVVRSGTAQGLASYLPPELNIAGKTGTTDDLRDSWFAGFSGDKVGVIWIGRDDNSPAGLTGSGGAMQVWGDMMRRLNPEPLSLARPDNVETVWIEPDTGMLADERCETAIRFPFVTGTSPTLTSGCIREANKGPIGRLLRSFFE
jgi:penicillin-binding protein 1B